MKNHTLIRSGRCFFASCVILLFAVPANAQEAVPSFLKVGEVFDITYVAHSETDSFPRTVKVLEIVGGGWVRIQYAFYVGGSRRISASESPTPTPSKPKLIKEEMWLNFSNIISIKKTPESNSSFTDFSE